MSPVLEAKVNFISSTSSSEEKDWYNYFDEGETLTVEKLFELIDLVNVLPSDGDTKFNFKNTGTSAMCESMPLSNMERIEIFSSPLLPPKKKFSVLLQIKAVSKGRPSICNEVEI